MNLIGPSRETLENDTFLSSDRTAQLSGSAERKQGADTGLLNWLISLVFISLGLVILTTLYPLSP